MNTWHFTPKELGIGDEISWDAIAAMKELVGNILEPLRLKYGKAIKVNSGWRSVEHNAVVGGAPNSQHLFGEAADITAGSPAENQKLFSILKQMNFDQLILEQRGVWIHVSYTTRHKNRRQIIED